MEKGKDWTTIKAAEDYQRQNEMRTSSQTDRRLSQKLVDTAASRDIKAAVKPMLMRAMRGSLLGIVPMIIPTTAPTTAP